jgi:hypothetical protein
VCTSPRLTHRRHHLALDALIADHIAERGYVDAEARP